MVLTFVTSPLLKMDPSIHVISDVEWEIINRKSGGYIENNSPSAPNEEERETAWTDRQQATESSGGQGQK